MTQLEADSNLAGERMRPPHWLLLPSFGPEPLLVHRLRGTEDLSGPFRFDVRATMRRDGAAPSVDELLGQNAVLHFGAGGAERTVHALVATARTDEEHPPFDRVGYRLRLVPRLWLLRHQHRSRIFRQRRVDQVISRVLDDAGIGAVWRTERPVESLPTREYLTQYEESDYAFVLRLCAESGLLFRDATDTDGAPVVVFGSGPTAYQRPALDLRFAAESALDGIDSDRVTSFRPVVRVRANAAEYREWDPRRPAAPIRARLERGAPIGGDLEHYTHHPDLLFTHREHAEAEPSRALDRLRADARCARGESRAPELAPGRCFTVRGADLGGDEREHLVTRVEHRAWDAPGRTRRHLYENAFECVPADVTAALALQRRRTIGGTLTATVVGSGEIHTDPSAQVKVRFHWDRDGETTEHSSCWLRVMQPWAGAGWGTQFIPRVGMEVVVSFDGGDPDRPFVLGALYNGAHPPPFRLPDEADRSGIRTDSVGGEGFNEISFRDRAGDEQIYLHAQADLEEVVLRDHATTVSRDRRELVSGSASSRVLGSRSIETIGSEITRTAESSELHVAGPRTELLAGGRRVVVRGDETTRTTGRATHSVGQAYNLKAGTGLGVEVGSPDKPGSASIYAFGPAAIGSGSTITLRAEQRLVLECGEARIELSRDTLRLSAPKVVLDAEKELTAIGDGPRLTLDKNACLTADEVRMYSKGASVELDRMAHVDGDLVKLACGPDSPTGRGPEGRKPRTQPLELRMANARYEPFSNKEYVVKSGGVRIDGRTDGDGWLRERLPADATSADVTLWVGARPNGETRRYAISLEPLPPASTPRGATVRLKHLGYWYRAPSDELDDAVRAAIQSFQRDHGLELTGELDEKTVATLVAIHGS